MKRLLVFLLIPVFMLNSSLREVFKIPVVFAHFTEHQQVDEKLTLVDFLSMHYFGNDLNDNDEDRDMQLPFKKMDLPSAFQTIAFAETRPVFGKKYFFHPEQLILPDFRDFNLSSPALGCLFRPPIV